MKREYSERKEKEKNKTKKKEKMTLRRLELFAVEF